MGRNFRGLKQEVNRGMSHCDSFVQVLWSRNTTMKQVSLVLVLLGLFLGLF